MTIMIAVILLFIVCNTFAGDYLTEKSKLRFNGIGPVIIGMTFDNLSKTSKLKFTGIIEEWSEKNFEYEEYENCHYIEIEGVYGVSLMVVQGVIARIDIGNDNIETEAGASIGDSESNIMNIYKNKLIIRPHPYDDDGHYLIVKSPKSKHAIIFETDGDKVINYRAGRFPEVEYIEGCL
jgi:hypothetical protein